VGSPRHEPEPPSRCDLYSLSWARENVPLVGETLERSLEGLRKAGLPEQ